MSAPKVFFELLFITLLVWDILTISLNVHVVLTIILTITFMAILMVLVSYLVGKSAYNAHAKMIPLLNKFFFERA